MVSAVKNVLLHILKYNKKIEICERGWKRGRRERDEEKGEVKDERAVKWG